MMGGRGGAVGEGQIFRWRGEGCATASRAGLGKAAAGLPQSMVAAPRRGAARLGAGGEELELSFDLIDLGASAISHPMDGLSPDGDAFEGARDWPHAPPHRLGESGVYFVTARTRQARQLFDTPERRDWFQDLLFTLLRESGWTLEAWAVLSNHYHLVAHSPAEGAAGLGPAVQRLRSQATKRLNVEDGTPGRTRLWQNYRETQLTYQRSYLARLNYVHQNPRHHGLVPVASLWPWCSAAAFEAAVTPAWARTVASFSFDQIAREDGD